MIETWPGICSRCATTGVGVLATYAYDNVAWRSSVTFGNGTSQAYAYDGASRLQTHTTDLEAAANDLTQSLSYNPASQIASVTRSNDAYAWNGHFNQNDNSTPNGLNQLVNVGAKTITHDARGNVTAVGSDVYSYDSENRLVSAPGSSALSYDPLGRLYQLTSGATTRFGYDGLDRIAEYDGANAIQRRYVHGAGVDEPIVWYEGATLTSRRFLQADERGSVIAVSDSSGALLGINRYDDFGLPQTGNLGSFGYTGQTWLPGLGLWYYKARVYRPDLGRFLQTDPIGIEGGVNLYAYVGNDPVNWVDPEGLSGAPNVDGGGGICLSGDPRCDPGHNLPPDVTVPAWGAVSGNAAALLRNGRGAIGGAGANRGRVGTAGQRAGNKRRISPCMQQFLATKGLGGSNLPAVTFHEGHSGSLLAKAAFANGNPAITIQNNVYVAPGRWNNFREGTPGFFEEAIHAMQWHVSGSADFVFAWSIGSIAGAVFTLDPHNSPLEAQAMGMSVDLSRAYGEEGWRCGT